MVSLVSVCAHVSIVGKPLICSSHLRPAFLPNTISSADMGGHNGVAGPYTHFQELGVVTPGNESF